MLQLSKLKGKIAIIAIIVMFFVAGTALAQAETKTKICRHCKEEKHVCKARKQESKIQSKANKQLCKEICKENKQQK